MAIGGGDGSIVLTTKVDESGLKNGLSSLKSGVGKISKIFETVGVAAAGAFVGVTAAAIKAKTEFEQTAAKASTLFGGVDVDAQKLNNTILDISSSTGMAATELNEALYSALSAGIPVTEDMTEATGFLENAAKLAKAGFTDVDTAISATAKTLNAYGMDVSEAERIQGILIQTQNKGITTVGELGASLAQVTPTAAAFGVSFENVGAALATMTAQGTPTAQATTQLNSLIAELGKNGTTAAKNLQLAAEGSKYAGMSFNEMMSSGASLDEILMLLAQNAKENNVSMVDMFSSIEAGKAALAITSGEAETFKNNLSAMSDTTGLVEDAFNTMNNTLQGSFNQVKESWNNLLIAFATPNADVGSATDTLIDNLGNLANNLLPLVGNVFGSVFNAIPTPILVVAGAIGSIVAGITAYNAVIAIKNVLDEVQKITTGELAVAQAGLNAAMLASPITWVVAGVVALVAAFVILWNKSEAFRNFWIGLWETIKEAVSPVIDWMKDVFTTAWEAIKAVWDFVSPYFAMIWNNIKIVFSVVKDVLGAYFKTAWEAIKAVWDIVTGYFKAIWDTISGIFAVVKAVLSGDWSEAWEAIKGIVNTWADYFSNIWNSIKNVFAAVGQFFKTIFTSAWDGIKAVFANVKDFFDGVWQKIKSAFKFDEMLQIGKYIVEGLWNGIKNAKDWLLNKIKSFAHTITDGIKSFFGIASPSKVFRDEVGKNLMLGMAEGITGNERAVTMAMSRVQQGLANTSLATPAIVTGNVLPYHINAASSSIPTQIGSGATDGTETTVIREEHYYLSETELMTMLYKLVKGGERIQGKPLISGGAY